MNRKQRRAAASPSGPGANAPEVLAQAIQSHRQGRLDEAEGLYRRSLWCDPRCVDALHFLGVLTSGSTIICIAWSIGRRS